MSDNDETVCCIGFVTKKEILARLEFNGLQSKEYLEPIENLRDSQFLSLDKVNFYKELFKKHVEEKERHINNSTCSLNMSSEQDFSMDNTNSSLELNDTLAEMEAFMMSGIDYDVHVTPLRLQKDESTFSPVISSTVTEENANLFLKYCELEDKKHNVNNYQNITENSNSNIFENLTNYTKIMPNTKENNFKKSFECLKIHDNIKNDLKTPTSKKFGSANNLLASEICTPKCEMQNAIKKSHSSHKIIPSNINTIPEKNKLRNQLFQTENPSKTTKENINPNSAQKPREIFKQPLSKIRTPYKNIISPISRYIYETPSVPLLQKVVPKMVPVCDHKFKTPTKSLKGFADLPEINYKPTKNIQLTYNTKSSPLPKNIDKYISKPLRPEIIKHKGRINVKNEYEEIYECIPIESNIEDLSTFIDLETTRYGEISVMFSSEAKFSSELHK